MRLPLLLATLLLLGGLMPTTASATSHLHLDLDLSDPADDARAYPDVTLPQTDIVRLTTEQDGEDIVQTVHVVGPIPENRYWFELRNTFGSGASLTLKVERMNSSGSNSRATDYPTSSVSPGTSGSTRVNFTFERTETSIAFRWPASAIPASATCFGTEASTLSRTVVEGREQQVDDEIDMSPNVCAASGVRLDGVDGTCPAPRSALVKAGTLQDGEDDVGERDNLAYLPHDDPTLDILSLDTRLEDGWVVQTVKTAERSPRDEADFEIQTQYRGNESAYSRGAYVNIRVYGSSAIGSIIGEGTPGSFHARLERASPGGWEARWCASIIPADAVCFAPSARATLDNGDFRDVVGLPKDPCPQPDEDAEGSSGTPTVAGEGADGEGEPEQGEQDEGASTPGVGAWGALAVLALAAAAFRRRGA